VEVFENTRAHPAQTAQDNRTIHDASN